MEGVLRNQVRLLPHNEEWDTETNGVPISLKGVRKRRLCVII